MPHFICSLLRSLKNEMQEIMATCVSMCVRPDNAGGVASGDAEGSVRRVRAAGLPGGEAVDSARPLSPYLLPVRTLWQPADAGQLLRDRGGPVLLRNVSGRGDISQRALQVR